MTEPNTPPWCKDCEYRYCINGGKCAVDVFSFAAMCIESRIYELSMFVDAFDEYAKEHGEEAAENHFCVGYSQMQAYRTIAETKPASFAIAARELDNLATILAARRKTDSLEASIELNKLLLGALGCSYGREGVEKASRPPERGARSSDRDVYVHRHDP